MRLRNKYLLALCASLFSGICAEAIPAYPGVITASQPDGTMVELILQGDEYCNWAKTTDGYTLLRNNKGYWTFACKDGNGMVSASDYVYRGDTQIARQLNIEKGLQFDASQSNPNGSALRKAKSDSGLQVDGTFPTKGKNKLLVLLLNYSDTETAYTQEDFDKLMNQKGYKGIGSFKDFYLENSYGQLEIETVVTRWVTLPYSKSYYGSERAIEMIQNGLNILDDEINLADFDNDGDGILDGLAVIHQGTGQETTGNSTEVWSHSSTIYGMSFDGIQVRRYTIEPELFNTKGDMTNIGVICHEFGHNLGAPDFYDSDYQSSGGEFPGTGIWDLMASGAWNGNNGDRPAGINMWQKIQCGWVEPIVLTDNRSIADMASAHDTPIAYRFDTTVPGEYFILENRQQQGEFDSSLPGHGLLIYHANEDMIKSRISSNTVNALYPQAMYLVCSAADTNPNENSYTYGDLRNAAFPGTSNVRSFSDETTPSTRSITGRYTYKSLENIQESPDGKISFNFVSKTAPASPINFEAKTEKGKVFLTWEMPEGAKKVEKFNVYRNNSNIASTKNCSFIDEDLRDESYLTYYVDAEYSDGLISPYASASIRVPRNFVANIDSVVTGTSVELRWGIDNNLTRMVDFVEGFSFIEYNEPELDYVHRFRAEDLQIYKGYTINKIAYLPYLAQKDMTITLRVWEADADGSNPKIISERVVKEYGTAVWNTTLLTKKVEITGEKELWIGVNCKSSTGTIRLIVDKGPVVEDYGNWIKIGNGEWMADKQMSGNHFLYAPLVEPEIAEVEELGEVEELKNPYLDMLFPVGYAVYRDDELLTTTSSRRFVDSSPLAGTHTYSIASIYRGGNESNMMPIEVDFSDAGVGDIAIGDMKIAVEKGAIILPDYNGALFIADILGNVVYNGQYVSGNRISLIDGLYLVKTVNGVSKIAVR